MRPTSRTPAPPAPPAPVGGGIETDVPPAPVETPVGLLPLPAAPVVPPPVAGSPSPLMAPLQAITPREVAMPQASSQWRGGTLLSFPGFMVTPREDLLKRQLRGG